jgi:PKD repeat protein
MVGRSLVIVTFIVLMAALMLFLPSGALAGDEDFYGIEGRPIAMNVTVDPGAAVDKWWWDFEGDGCFTWSSSAGPNTTVTYQEPGTYFPVLKATHGNDTVKYWIYEVLVDPENEPPLVIIADEYKGTMTGETVVFTGTAVDDGHVVLYQWDFNGDGIWDYESTNNPDATWVYPTKGNYTVILRATDDQGATGTDTVLVTVHNQPPVIDKALDIVTDQSVVNISISAHDPDGEIVAYHWDPGDGSDNITTEVPLIIHEYAPEGSYRVWVTVFDDDGANSTANLKVTVNRPFVPAQVIASASATQVHVNEEITFHVQVIEGSRGGLVVSWDFDDGNFSFEETVVHAYQDPGTYHVMVSGIDPKNVAVWDDLTIRVLWTPNEPPVAVPSVEQWVLPGRNLRFSEESFDPDGYIVLYQWDFEGDGTFDYSNVTDGNVTHVYPEEGIYISVLQVTDDRGAVAVATATIKVDRDAPGEPGPDDTEGAAICCGVLVVLLIVTAYWAMRKSLATPRKDGGPGSPEEGEEALEEASLEEGPEADGAQEPPPPAD